MQVCFVAGFGPIVRDLAASRAFWGDASGSRSRKPRPRTWLPTRWPGSRPLPCGHWTKRPSPVLAVRRGRRRSPCRRRGLSSMSGRRRRSPSCSAPAIACSVARRRSPGTKPRRACSARKGCSPASPTPPGCTSRTDPIPREPDDSRRHAGAAADHLDRASGRVDGHERSHGDKQRHRQHAPTCPPAATRGRLRRSGATRLSNPWSRAADGRARTCRFVGEGRLGSRSVQCSGRMPRAVG